MTETADCQHGYFEKHLNMLKLAAAAWTLALLLFHSLLSADYIWTVAVILLVAMNFTYPIEALTSGRFVKSELSAAIILSLLALMSLWSSPLFVILAIFGHGLWDIRKFRGNGVKIAKWYTSACFVADLSYATLLLLYWLRLSLPVIPAQAGPSQR